MISGWNVAPHIPLFFLSNGPKKDLLMTSLRLRVTWCCTVVLFSLSSTAYAKPAGLTATQHYDTLLQSASARNTSTPKALAALYAANRVRL